jgi:LemA protein
MAAAGIVIGLLVLLVIVYFSTYNALVKAKVAVENAWAGIDVQLKRRYDLIPNLINTVKGYAKHEAETLANVTKARTAAMGVPDGNVADQAAAENMLSGTLKSIFALSEAYPDLKADTSFLELQRELSNTEDQIAASRRIYNSNVTILNTKVQTVPSNIVASVSGFANAEFFELDEAERAAAEKAPEVNF